MRFSFSMYFVSFAQLQFQTRFFKFSVCVSDFPLLTSDHKKANTTKWHECFKMCLHILYIIHDVHSLRRLMNEIRRNRSRERFFSLNHLNVIERSRIVAQCLTSLGRRVALSLLTFFRILKRNAAESFFLSSIILSNRLIRKTKMPMKFLSLNCFWKHFKTLKNYSTHYHDGTFYDCTRETINDYVHFGGVSKNLLTPWTKQLQSVISDNNRLEDPITLQKCSFF